MALIPGLIWAGTTFSTTTESEVLLEGEGLGSLYGPPDSLAETREREVSPSREAVPRQYGATFWATAVIWVPREIWDSKPLGWRAVLAETLSPRNRDVGQSDASLIAGEFHAKGATFVDVTPLLCQENRCPAIAGNVLVYRDGNHLTTAFMASRSDDLIRPARRLTGLRTHLIAD
jgi:hypothetical protein